MKKLLAMVLVLALLLTGCSKEIQVVKTFTYAEIKEQAEAVTVNNADAECEEIIPISTLLADKEPSTLVLDNNIDGDILRGVILVLEALPDSKNMLISRREKNGKRELYELTTAENNSKLTTEDLYATSHTKTMAVIKEVIHQPADMNLKPGDTVQVWENYYILDDRVAHLKNKNSTKKYQLSTGGWGALEAGEIYYFCGSYCEIPSQGMNGYMWSTNGIYCLSDPEKRVGWPKEKSTFEENVEYLKQKYDFTKYGLK